MTWLFAIVVPITLSLIAILFPFKSKISTSSSVYCNLQHRNQKWEVFSLVPFFILFPLLTYVFAQLFLKLVHYLNEPDSDIIYHVLPLNFMWYIPAGILSISLLGFILEGIYLLIFGRFRYEEYSLFTNLRHGFDGKKIFKPIALCCSIIAITTLVLLLDYSIKVYENEIEIDDFLTFDSKKYTYTQVKSINNVEMIEKKIIRFIAFIIT